MRTRWICRWLLAAIALAVLALPSLGQAQTQTDGGAAASGAPAGDQTAQQWFERAKTTTGDAEKLKAYSEAIRLDPRHAEALNFRATVYLRMKENALALADFDAAIKLDPNYALAFNNRAYLHLLMKSYALSVADYDRALQLKPDNRAAWYNRGNSKESLGDLPGACNDWRKAAELGFAGMKELVARSCLGQGTAGRGELTAQQWFDRGHSLWNERQGKHSKPSEAIGHYDSAVKVDPKFARAYLLRAAAYEELKLPERALESYDLGLGVQPDNRKAYNDRARVKEELDDLAGACSDWRWAGELGDADAANRVVGRCGTLPAAHDEQQLTAEQWLDRGRALWLEGESRHTNPTQAIAYYDKARGENPNHATIYAMRGAAYADMKLYERAIADYTEALSMNPGDGRTRWNRALAYRDQKKLGPACADMREAQKLGEKDAAEWIRKNCTP